MPRRSWGRNTVRLSSSFRSLAVVIGMALLVTSCEDRPNHVTGPSQGQTSPVTPAPPQPASLVIDQLSVGQPPLALQDGKFWYRVKFFVRETSGHSGATIRRIVVTSPDAVNDNAPWCWGDVPITVAPGGTLDVFTPETVKILLGDYCAPAALAHSDSFQLTVSITYTDATGQRMVDASATITR
jgi:hypothetical protein